MLILDKMEEKHTIQNRCREVDRTLSLGAANYITVCWIAEHIRVEMKRLSSLLRASAVYIGISSLCVVANTDADTKLHRVTLDRSFFENVLDREK